jgi:DivIVA domain-containing protein
MDLTPSQVSSASFRTVRKGYDPDEVAAFLEQAAKALEQSQQQATAMEARARAAVARLQEVTAAAEQTALGNALDDAGAADSVDVVHVSADEAETISRTLVLAQRTADATIAEARAEADRLLNESRAESEATLDSTREMSAKLLDDARTEARNASEAERQAAQDEVQSLVARRAFLVGDVDQLEQFLVEQRERLRTAARQLEEMCDGVPAGLGHADRPLLSASDEPPGDDTAEHFRPPEASMFEADVDEDDDRYDNGYGDDHVHRGVVVDDPSRPDVVIPVVMPMLPPRLA